MNMNIAFVAIVGILLSSCSLTTSAITVKKNEKSVSKKVNVGNFNAISTTSFIDVEYSKGARSITLIAPERLMPYITTDVASNGTLTIGVAKNENIIIEGNQNIKAIISAPQVYTFRTEGSGNITIADGYSQGPHEVTASTGGSGDIIFKGHTKINELNLSTAGSGDIQMGNIDCVNCHIATYGSGDVKIQYFHGCNISAITAGSGEIAINKGEGVEAVFNTSGSGDILAKDLKCTAVNAVVNGTGDIACNATTSFVSQVNGTGDVHNYNTSTVHTSVSNSSGNSRSIPHTTRSTRTPRSGTHTTTITTTTVTPNNRDKNGNLLQP